MSAHICEKFFFLGQQNSSCIFFSHTHTHTRGMRRDSHSRLCFCHLFSAGFLFLKKELQLSFPHLISSIFHCAYYQSGQNKVVSAMMIPHLLMRPTVVMAEKNITAKRKKKKHPPVILTLSPSNWNFFAFGHHPDSS